MAKRYYVTRNGRRIEERREGFRETLAPPAAGQVVYQEPVAVERASARPLTAIELLVGWVAGIIEVLLAIRFVFSLLSANTGNGFAAFIYNTTNPLVDPFNNLFNTTPSLGIGYFDWPAIAAFVAVALIAWALASLARIGRRTVV